MIRLWYKKIGLKQCKKGKIFQLWDKIYMSKKKTSTYKIAYKCSPIYKMKGARLYSRLAEFCKRIHQKQVNLQENFQMRPNQPNSQAKWN